ncbi:CTP synthase [Candidatus Daviesbacteria bacterium RIFCSPHIGHO2_01_FULL_40_11]|uniref:CTP synthase n=1 Tax=Candidatus Daviesbacteria bacterium RIFCSPHIGHO2_01_FULL_40_11 TaxID=1797762 RepID=A0A1F5JFD5_9BACT|nr:MAG: CTP synthase [Candidatus Daviesbacteria bacterium RIFCSPHIGHO2_01_FULL_40_11]OGE62698.1 MAG: CTP synthase [Candidatus Daviesbacteria bacterium RIFCSPLOWO2_01_FULL_40_27]
MKYIFVTGGVISGLGKGIATSSIALLLKSAGYKVTPIKMDPYLNVDAGTMNPIEHGEVFVLDDGTETDQDLGHYERFLNESLSEKSIATQGSIYLSVIQRERNLEYDGECVDVVTYVTEEIIKRIKEAGRANNADLVVIEIGGTTGEYQNILFLEANRLMKLKNPEDVLHAHITYLPIPASIGEMKSKPAQMSVRDLNAVGIQPDILLARSEKPLDLQRIKKLSISTGLEPEDIISAPDVDSIYKVPIGFDKQNLTSRLLDKLGLERKKKDLKEWSEFVNKIDVARKEVKIAIVGKYFSTGAFTLADSYISVIEAVKHAVWSEGLKPEITWLDSGKVLDNVETLRKFQGIIVPGGFGSRDIEGKIEAIKYARVNKIPYFGLCYGMQLAVVEYARDVLELPGAHTTEIDPETKYPVIHIMPDQEKKMLNREYGATMRLGAWDCKLKEGTLVRSLYGKSEIAERHRHRFEFNNEFLEQFMKKGLIISGTSPDGRLVEIIELKDHPFFVGTQFHPELKSRPLSPHPLFVGFIKAASEIKLT